MVTLMDGNLTMMISSGVFEEALAMQNNGTIPLGVLGIASFGVGLGGREGQTPLVE